MILKSIHYQVEKNGPWARGVLVNEGSGPILDVQGAEVTEVWDYRDSREFLITMSDEPWQYSVPEPVVQK